MSVDNIQTDGQICRLLCLDRQVNVKYITCHVINQIREIIPLTFAIYVKVNGRSHHRCRCLRHHLPHRHQPQFQFKRRHVRRMRHVRLIRHH